MLSENQSQKQHKFLPNVFRLKNHWFYSFLKMVLNIFNIILKNMIFLSAAYIIIKSKSYLSHQQLIFFP